MALIFKWDEIAFRKATAGWKPMARMLYREIIPWLHLNDGSVTDAQLQRGYRDFECDPKPWRKWTTFIVEQGKLVRTSEGEWTNLRVAEDHSIITGGGADERRRKRESRRQAQEISRNDPGDLPSGCTGYNSPGNPAENPQTVPSEDSGLDLPLTRHQKTDARTQETGESLCRRERAVSTRAEAPPAEKTDHLTSASRDRSQDYKNEFEHWWHAYPCKVGKKAARPKYLRLVKTKVTTPAELMAGLQRYIASKPRDQDWCHPTTWLSRGSWEDVENVRGSSQPDPLSRLYAKYQAEEEGGENQQISRP